MLWEVGTHILVRHHVGSALCDSLKAQESFLEGAEIQKDKAEQVRLSQSDLSSQPAAYDPSDTAPRAEYNDYNSTRSQSLSEEEGGDALFMQYVEELRDKGMDKSDIGDTKDYCEMEDEISEDERDNNPTLVNQYLPANISIGPDSGTSSSVGSAVPVMGTYVRVVHMNGIHNLAMISCECCGHDMLPCDLLASRLLPASFQKIRTLFTAQVLDLFHLCNLELKASAYQFYHLLQRFTCPSAPAEVDNLY